MGRTMTKPNRGHAGPALWVLGLLLLFPGLLGGCAWTDGLWDEFFGGGEEQAPAELAVSGEDYLEEGRYGAAADAFQAIKDRYPYSPYAIRAELRMADALFKRGEYDVAFDSYDEFERLHPRNEFIPYVIFQKGECYLQRLTTIDRDQSHSHKAQAEFERLVKRFPNHPLAKVARKKIRKCLIFLSEYELYVGHYYFDRKQYKAAMGRYQYIIENYPDMGQYNEALEYIRICRQILAEQHAEAEAEAAEEEAKAAEEAAEEAEEIEAEPDQPAGRDDVKKDES
jgi:outer membrane protein assembly factor BamD